MVSQIYQREIESYKKSLDYYERYLIESKRKESSNNFKKNTQIFLCLKKRIILNRIMNYATEATFDAESAKGVVENSFYEKLKKKFLWRQYNKKQNFH